MSGFVRVATLAELAEELPVRVQVDGVPVCLVRSGGEVFALGDTCSHAEVSLAEGEVSDGAVECWLHGSRFDLRSGKPTCLPATEPVPTYPVRIEGDAILVAVEE